MRIDLFNSVPSILKHFGLLLFVSAIFAFAPSKSRCFELPSTSQQSCRLLAYSINIQSQIFSINGCFYRVRGTLTFDWDGVSGHSPTNVTLNIFNSYKIAVMLL